MPRCGGGDGHAATDGHRTASGGRGSAEFRTACRSGKRQGRCASPGRSAAGALLILPFAIPTMLAPMEGVTHPLFRELTARRGGVGVVCTEFVRISNSPLGPEALRREVVRCEAAPLSVQVMGRDGEAMAEAASVIARAGADVVDVNMGCPTRAAAKGGVGAAMLKDPRLVYEVLSRMRAVVPGLLSAKIRAGFDDATHVVEIAETVQRAGADFIVVHPRRRCDHYEGVADWRIIRTLKEALAIPVVGNGDAWYAADVLRMREETGCDAVMLGRPALRNPWIFVQVDELRRGAPVSRPSGAQLAAHIAQTAELYRPRFGKGAIGMLKELVRWCGRAVDDDKSYVRAAMRCATIDEMLAVTDRLVRPLPAEAIDLGPHGELQRERSGSAAAASDGTSSAAA